MVMNINQIKEVIPHRYPFLFIDRITHMEKGKNVIAIKNVTANEEFFNGHFPAEPLMPGVLIVEAMAQAGACAILSMPEYENKMAYFGALNNVKFRAKVIPGDTLRLEVEIVKLKKIAGIGKGIAYVGNKKVAEAEFTFMIG